MPTQEPVVWVRDDFYSVLTDIAVRSEVWEDVLFYKWLKTRAMQRG